VRGAQPRAAAFPPRAASHPADPRRGASLRHRGTPRATRQSSHDLHAERDSRHRREAPPGAALGLWWTARGPGRGRGRHRQGGGHQPSARRAHLPPPARRPVILNVPNIVTLSRIILIPVLRGVYYRGEGWLTRETQNIVGTSVFILAGITDWLDGYLARKLNQMSAFGAFLDPVADKLIVVAALVVLLHLEPPRVHAFVALIILGREIAISALREWMAKVGQAKSVAVAFIGKLKTVSQMVAIPLLLFHERLLGLDCQWLGTILINVAAVLTVISMFYYLRKALPY